jgi:hypothetical protein
MLVSDLWTEARNIPTSHWLARAFKIINPEPKNPATESWERLSDL